jgi:hypothetical protein
MVGGFYFIFIDDQADFPRPAPQSAPAASTASGTPALTVAAPEAAEKSEEIPQVKIIAGVPFTAQAPFGDWNDVKQDYGCEEACLLMAMHWLSGEPLTPAYARDQIIAISEFELAAYQHHHDYSIADTAKVLEAYFGYKNFMVVYDVGMADLKKVIAAGQLAIIPIDGRLVTNPYFNVPGPFHHQVLAIGYDDGSRELIVHDPGTSRGEAFRYAYREIEAAWRDYATGLNEPVEAARTAMLVIKNIRD